MSKVWSLLILYESLSDFNLKHYISLIFKKKRYADLFGMSSALVIMLLRLLQTLKERGVSEVLQWSYNF